MTVGCFVPVLALRSLLRIKQQDFPPYPDAILGDFVIYREILLTLNVLLIL